MLLNVSFKQLNNEYSELLSKQLEFDKESISNPKYLLENSLELTSEIDEIIIKENQDISLELEFSSGETAKFLLESMTKLLCIKDNEVVAEFSVSRELIHNTHKIMKENSRKTYYYFYLKDQLEYSIIDKKIYVLNNRLKRIE